MKKYHSISSRGPTHYPADHINRFGAIWNIMNRWMNFGLNSEPVDMHPAIVVSDAINSPLDTLFVLPGTSLKSDDEQSLNNPGAWRLQLRSRREGFPVEPADRQCDASNHLSRSQITTLFLGRQRRQMTRVKFNELLQIKRELPCFLTERKSRELKAYLIETRPWQRHEQTHIMIEELMLVRLRPRYPELSDRELLDEISSVIDPIETQQDGFSSLDHLEIVITDNISKRYEHLSSH